MRKNSYLAFLIGLSLFVASSSSAKSPAVIDVDVDEGLCLNQRELTKQSLATISDDVKAFELQYFDVSDAYVVVPVQNVAPDAQPQACSYGFKQINQPRARAPSTSVDHLFKTPRERLR